MGNGEISGASGILLDNVLSLASEGVPIAFSPTWSSLFLKIQATVFSQEGKRRVRGQPDKPGFVISLLQRRVRVALFIQCVGTLFPGPDECRRGRFRHRLLFRLLCVSQQFVLDDYIPRYTEKQVFPNTESVHEARNVEMRKRLRLSHRASPLGNKKMLFLLYIFVSIPLAQMTRDSLPPLCFPSLSQLMLPTFRQHL